MTARILIVDDMPANTRLLEAKLSAEYYQVATAQDGFEALRLAHAWQPDLILLDVMMPDMDGCEVAQKLQEDRSCRKIPIVYITALVAKSKSANKKSKVYDYPCLAKPVTLDDLTTGIELYLKKKA